MTPMQRKELRNEFDGDPEGLPRHKQQLLWDEIDRLESIIRNLTFDLDIPEAAKP